MSTIDQPPTTLASFDHLQPRAGVLKAWVGGGDGISRGVGHAGRPGGDRVHRVYEKMTECFAHTTGLPSFSAPCLHSSLAFRQLAPSFNISGRRLCYHITGDAAIGGCPAAAGSESLNGCSPHLYMPMLFENQHRN